MIMNRKKEAKKSKRHKGDQNESKREAYYSKLGINPGLVENNENNFKELNWNDNFTESALNEHFKEPVRKRDYQEPDGEVGYETVTIMSNDKEFRDHYKPLKSDSADNQKGQPLTTNIPKKPIQKEDKLTIASPVDISVSKSVGTDDFHWTEHAGDIAFSFESEISDVFGAGYKNYTDAEETNQTFSPFDKNDLSLDGTLAKETLKANELKYVNMNKQTKRRLYKCGENFLINEQIPCWIETSRHNTGKDKPVITHKLTTKEEFLPDVTLNQKVALWFGDITRLEIDVIVNSTSSILMDTAAGVNKAIREAAGPELDLELEAKFQIVSGSVFKTPGFKLPAKWIYHCSGPPEMWKNREQYLSMCYTNALNLMKDSNCRTIAFPCISAGSKGIRVDVSAEVALKTVRKWLADNLSCVDKVIFCIYDRFTLGIYDRFMHLIYPATETSPETVQAQRLPVEILRMDSKSIELYKKALEEGKEKDYNIRLMVVGPFGVGKTSFTKRLLRQNVNISERNSTDGIDVHVRRCKVSLETSAWTVDPTDTEEERAVKRIAKVLGSTNKIDADDSSGQSLDYNDSQEQGINFSASESEGGQSVEESTNQSQSSKEASSTVSHPDFVDGLEPSYSDSLTCPSEQEDILMKGLKELVGAGNIFNQDDNAIVSIWDFGGQFVFYTTHQMFLSHRAIYILVSNLSQHIGDLVIDDEPYFDCCGPQSLKIEDFIDIWLNSIHGHSNCDNPGAPPVILVGTHTDKLKEEQREEQVEALFDAIRNRFAGKDVSLHFTDKDFGLSNATNDEKFEELRQTITEVAKQQSYWGELKPVKWVPLEKVLEGLRKRGVEIINRSSIAELCNTLPVPVSSDEELDLFLRFQHEVANIMYFSIPELRDKIVLTPQFLVNALKSLITAEMFCKKKPEILESWREFRQKGLLKSNLLDAVWKKDENTRFQENRSHILALMEHLNIIARPISYTENDEAKDTSTTQEQDYFLVPCMLKESPPQTIFQSEGSFISTPCLCLMLDNVAFPSALFNRLLVACMSRWPVARRGKKYLVYCGCGQFDVDLQHRLTLSFSSNVIGLRIVRYCETDRHPSCILCKNVYSEVKQMLQRIGESLALMFSFEEFVKCPLDKMDSVECLHAVNKLKESDEFPCHAHDHVKILHSCELLRYWFASDDQNSGFGNQLQSQSLLSPQISSRVPTDKELVKVSKGIGKEFQQLALQLGLSNSRIDQIRGSYPLSVADQIIQLLLEWRKQRGRQATFQELEKAMISVGVDTDAALREIIL